MGPGPVGARRGPALRLVPFDAADAGIVSSWAASVEEVAAPPTREEWNRGQPVAYTWMTYARQNGDGSR
jgi:hypothetical protein